MSAVLPQEPDVGHGLLVVLDFALAHAWWIGAAALMVLAGWAATAWWWRRWAVRELQHRARVELVPSVTFDPGQSEVGRVASRLGSVRAAAGALPRRASAVRIRIAAGDEGRLHYWWEGPERAASLLRVSGYRQVEVVTDTARPAGRRVRFEDAPPLNQGGAW